MASKSTRSAFTLVEVVAAATVLATLLLVVAQAVLWTAASRRTSERRQWALVEANNALEQVTANDWNEINPEQAAKLELSETAREVLGADALSLNVSDVEGEPPARKITVEVRFMETVDSTAGKVRLITWVYRRGEP